MHISRLISSFFGISLRLLSVTVLVPLGVFGQPAPNITQQPQSQTAVIGTSLSFSVAATGQTPFTYQWSFNGLNLTNNAQISGVTNQVLSLANIDFGNGGNYQVVLHDQNANATTSSVAMLTVVLPPCLPPPTGVVGWWSAEGNASDFTGTNNGTGVNGISYSGGEVGQAFVFGLTNSAVRVPASSSLDVGTGSGLTLEAWINPADVTQTHALFEWNDGNWWGVHFHIAPWQPSSGTPGPGQLYANVVDNNGGWHQLGSAGGVVASNVFQHVALTYDRNSGIATIYCNGQIVSQQNLGGFTPLTSYDLYLGRRQAPSDATESFQGLMDEAAVYNRALSTTEIQAIYQAGAAGKCSPLIPMVPYVYSQPVSRTVLTNTTTTFNVLAGGTPPLSYQWYFNGAPLADSSHINGSATNSLFVFNSQQMDAGNYYVKVTNTFGSVTSSIASLLVLSNLPSIVSQPQDLTIIAGTNAGFSAVANGDAPLSYQWYFNNAALMDGAHISGSTSSNLIVLNVQSGDAGNYFLIVTNPIGMATSSVAALTVLLPPVVTTQPVGRSVPPGLPTTFSAVATGTAPLYYQWQLNGTNIPGATSASYAIAAVGTNDIGLYHLIVSNALTVTVSADAQLTFGSVAAWGRNLSNESLPPPGLNNVIAVAGSFGASFAARTDGTAATWGGGTLTNVPASFSNIVALSASGGLLALRSDGSVVGSGSIDPAQYQLFPTNVIAIAAGYQYGLALRAEGTVIGWLAPSAPTIGIPAANIPIGLTKVTAIAAGQNHSLALRSDGTVFSWGTGVVTNVPLGLNNVVAIAAGDTYSLALKTNGTIVAWGSGAATNLPAGLTNIATIFADNYVSVGGPTPSFALAIRSNGTVVIWGGNPFGETNPPTALTNLTSVTAAGSAYHGLALINDGSPQIIHPPIGLTSYTGRDVVLHGDAAGAQPMSYQWLCNGTNIPNATNSSLTISNIQLGSAGNYQLLASNALNIAASLPAPLIVISNNALTFLSMPTAQTNYQGGKVSLSEAVLGNGPLQYQWYFSRTNTGYALVSGGTNDSLFLEPALAVQSGNYFVAVSNQFAGITSAPVNVRVLFAKAWGYQTVSNPPVNVTNAIALATGGPAGSPNSHFLALGADGKVVAWGNYFTTSGETNVSALSNSIVTAIAASSQHTLALKSDGTIFVAGVGATNPPTGLNGVTAIACGTYHDLALKADGTIAGWFAPGQVNFNYGQSTNYPAATNVVAIAAGQYHSLALRADGSVVGWGNGGDGSISIPITTSNATIAIAAGNGFSVALRTNGTVVQWGNGIGNFPVPSNLSNVVAISASVTHVVALKNDGTVVSWGSQYINPAASNQPVDLANVVGLASGGEHDIALFGTRAPTFTVQPWSRAVTLSSGTITTVTLAGKVAGVQPMSYQWRLNGTNYPGATNDTLTFRFNGQVGGNQIPPGTYQLVASNIYGVAVSKPAKVTLVIPLSEALDTFVDNPAGAPFNLYNWITTGSAQWFGETNITHDGVDAARSGGIGALQESILQTTVATNWPGRYTFWWKVSSEQYFDALEFRLNGAVQTSISGEVDWQQVNIPVAAGTNILQWRYAKDASFDAGQDAGFVDQFVFIPNPPVINLQPQPASQTVNMGATVTYNVSAVGAPQLNYQWRKNGNAIGASANTLTLPNVGRAQNGTYFVIITNPGGSITSSVVNLKVLVPQLLGKPTLSPDGSLLLNSTDANGGLLSTNDLVNFEAQRSTNLTDWVTLPNALNLTNGTLQLQDNNGTNWPSRFYRIVEH